MIGYGLGVLHLAPEAFWRMTPRELALALEYVAAVGDRPLGPPALAELMRRFPDRPG